MGLHGLEFLAIRIQDVQYPSLFNELFFSHKASGPSGLPFMFSKSTSKERKKATAPHPQCLYSPPMSRQYL